jgi:hypothetical protein
MSTQFYTQDQPATSQPADHRGRQGPAAPGRPAPDRHHDPATQAALARYLAHGNNQMAG